MLSEIPPSTAGTTINRSAHVVIKFFSDDKSGFVSIFNNNLDKGYYMP
jgi:hypothetical protein